MTKDSGDKVNFETMTIEEIIAYYKDQGYGPDGGGSDWRPK